MIEMSVRHQNRVCFWRELAQSIVDARDVRLNPRTKYYAQKVHAREVRIHKQGMASEFELVTARAEISHAHSVARCARRICHNQIGIRAESRAKSIRGECQEKQKAHVTTDNADVTDVEAKAASDTKALQICLSRVVRGRSVLILFA
jgi:hypothetical protein